VLSLQGGNYRYTAITRQQDRAATIMARTVRDSTLESRTARARLKPREWAYWRALEPGLHVGFYKPLEGPGSWVRRYRDPETKRYRQVSLGAADDFSDPDDVEVLSFAQAVRKARAERATRAQAGYSVASAMDDYLAALEADGRSPDALQDARYRDHAFIRPKLGTLELAELTADRLRRWHQDLAKAPPRLRTRSGKPQQHRELVDGEDPRRARRATANRTWTVLRAALNLAFARDKIDSDKAWRKVKPFRGVERARLRYLTLVEAKRLDNAIESEPELRLLWRGALQVGARYGQLTALTVADFNPDAGTLRLRSRKGDGTEKIFHIHLTVEAQRFFATLCAGRDPSSLIFTRSDGGRWGKSHQVRSLREASVRARISPPATFHTARHTFASHAVMNGVPLMVVAQALGHVDTRMVERVYGHLAPSYVAEAIRAGAPKFGFKPDRKIIALRP
jgi:integrase